ncbi:MAG: 2-dehydro-3-deoxygluconokinase [Sphingomonas sp. 28-63-12]|nr:MAG: 2-dehydro-3-deoxygluconokinase [Sphingomonas sp. 28-63-12]
MVSTAAKVVVVGEGMLELSRRGAEWTLGYGGDTLNTAVHLARYGFDTEYFSALGNDPFSVQLRADWQQAGLGTNFVLTDPTRQAGLYAITTDPAGERSFTYWRADSAARQMFSLPESPHVEAMAGAADLLVFSLVTLAILPPEGRERLLAVCRAVRSHGGKVAFDGNYRPRLWANRKQAGGARDAAISCADFGLPTFEDEAMLCGTTNPARVADDWYALGCKEVIVKLGSEGCLLPDGRAHPPAMKLAPKDTSGAGDAFNAGYLAARLSGASPEAAAQAGHKLAAWTVMRSGAIPQRDSDAPYSS